MKTRKDKEESTLINEEHIFKMLESLKKGEHGLQTPDGYYDNLSSRIADRIHMKKPSAFEALIAILKKRVVFIPATALLVLVISLYIVFPSGKTVTAIAENELSQISLAYDASYAEEAYFSESCLIENELKGSGLALNTSNIVQPEEATTTEIIEYLGNQELDPELLSNY